MVWFGVCKFGLWDFLKIPGFLAVFHGGLGAFVVGASSPLGLTRGGDFLNDFA
jgi:hypothetical protein